MIVILRQDPDQQQLMNLRAWLESRNIRINTSMSDSHMVLILEGDTSLLDVDMITALDIVEDVRRIQEPYKNSSRRLHPKDTVIQVGNTQIGGGTLTIMAGPCSVESEEQMLSVARAVKESGASILRGGAFKPRTSPYSFQGLGEEGLRLLKLAKKETGLPVISEITEISQLELFQDVDIIQVGTRNMQNFNLLKELGAQDKPIMLKRGMSATYEELLMSAEYVISEGNSNVILCERGIRTFEPYTRNTLDLSAIPVLKKLSHFPIIVDPSHASGKASLVPSLAAAAVAGGADGLIIEVHSDPGSAWSDGSQSLRTENFDRLSRKLYSLYSYMKALEQ